MERLESEDLRMHAEGWRAQRSAAVRISVLSLAALLLVSCGSSGGGGTGGTSGGAACARLKPAQYLANARIAFFGTMLPGQSVKMDGSNVLVSPARVRVARYLKGRGPDIVTVTTAVTRAGSTNVVNGDGIEAQSGQKWQIYTSSNHVPFETSICAGTKQLASR
jgi:hypothetical protein